ncbi:MAG: GNAT family N-acetyltransferase [Oceanobacter sp.]
MIETVSHSNLHDVLPLIRAYQAFYQVADIDDERNRTFFSQFGENSEQGCQFLYRDGERVVGFATVYFSFTSTIAAKVAVLNDLYTEPDCRGQGVGKQLIEHCRQYAAEKGAARLQWVTAPDNTQAQALYDSLDTRKSSWFFYSYGV